MGRSRKPKNEFPNGTVIGQWEVTKVLGRGGQGAVWAVKSTKTKRAPQRALKACFSTDSTDRARFEREIDLLDECNSPHVLQLVESEKNWAEHVESAPTFAYYVGEKCHGSMKDALRKQPDLRQRLTWFREACAAVSYLHSRANQVIHRDIKPANFLLANEPRRVVLADFGIAKSEVKLPPETATQEVVGSQYFRAPEILNCHPGDVESDVYSLGRVLELLLTDAVSTDLSTRPVPRNGELSDGACDILDRVIAKATQAIAENRYDSVEQLLDAVPELWLAPKPQPRPPTVSPNLDADAVLPAARQLARDADLTGWRELEQELRRAYVDRVKEWRESHEGEQPRQEDLVPATDELLGRALGRIVFALEGVHSRKPELSDQRRVLDDLVSIPDWRPNGYSTWIAAPRTLAYVFHYLHGTVCMDLGQYELGLQLALTPFPTPSGASGTEPLWRVHDVVGWPDLLGGECTVAWDYLGKLPDVFPILDTFFGMRRDFEIGLTGYSMLLSLLEAAHDAEAILARKEEERDRVWLGIPATFTSCSHDVIRPAAGRVFGDSAVVQHVARDAGIGVGVLQELWPYWKKAIDKSRHNLRPNAFFHDDLPLGELAS